MPVATTDYLAVISHMPAGTVLRQDDVPWEEYEQLLADLGEGYAARIFYDHGRMEIMAPSSAHERPKGVIHRLVTDLSDELDMDIVSLGSTTLKAELRARGAEPDECFYVQNASRVIGILDLDLANNPPPDLAVEVDRTSASLDKFPIYAGLGVPELWRLVRGEVRMYLLIAGRYEPSPVSRAFPMLTARALSEFLALGLAEGERKAAHALRAWVRRPPAP